MDAEINTEILRMNSVQTARPDLCQPRRNLQKRGPTAGLTQFVAEKNKAERIKAGECILKRSSVQTVPYIIVKNLTLQYENTFVASHIYFFMSEKNVLEHVVLNSNS